MPLLDDFLVGQGLGQQVGEGYTLMQLIQRVREVLRPGSNTHDLPSLGPQGDDLGTLRAKVREVLRDDSAQFIADAEIDGWLNEGLVQLAARSRSVRKTVTGNVGGTIPLPADFTEVLRVEVAGRPVDMQTSDEQWYDFVDHSVSGPRVIGRVFGQGIELYPDPGAVAYLLRYVARPTPLSGNTDRSEVPAVLQAQAVNYARAHGFLKGGDPTRFQQYMGLFSGVAPPAPTNVERTDPQTVTPHPPLPEPRPIPDYEIADFLNEAFTDLGFRLEIVRKETPGTTDGTKNVPIPAGFLRELTLRIGTDDVEFIDDQMWWDWSDTTAFPTHSVARIFGNNIEVYPTPSTGKAYNLRYVARPAVLVNGTDIPEVPVTIQPRAIEYARAKCKLIEGDFNSHDRYMSMYSAGLPSPDLKGRQTPGPLQLVPAFGPFDDAEARHI